MESAHIHPGQPSRANSGGHPWNHPALVVPFRLAFWLLVYKILGLAILRFTLQQPENLAPNTQKHITASPGSPLFQAHTPPWPGTAGSHICQPAPSCLSTLRATHSELGSAKAMLSKASHPFLRLRLLPGAPSPSVWVQELPWGSSPRLSSLPWRAITCPHTITLWFCRAQRTTGAETLHPAHQALTRLPNPSLCLTTSRSELPHPSCSRLQAAQPV